MENELEKSLCVEIAARSPFTAQQVYSAWEICKSFDVLIKAVDLCATLGLPGIVIPAADLPIEPLCICGKPISKHMGVVCLPEGAK